MEEKGASVCKQQFNGQLLDGLVLCEQTAQVEDAPVCPEADVDAVLHALLRLSHI